ncbi:MAG: flagellar hook assembly protein FlgD [Pseudomonadota bacterium]
MISDVASGSSFYDMLSIDKKKEEDTNKTDSDRNQFLELMVAQLKNQNPLKPQEGGEFLAQLAQFSTVEGVQKLNDSMSEFAQSFRSSQALAATALVGRKVEVPSNTTWQDGVTGVSGSVELPASTSQLTVNIETMSGQLVDTISLGSQTAGNIPFKWDGVTPSGATMSPGTVKVRAVAQTPEGMEEQAVFVRSHVDSVTFADTGEVKVNLKGGGNIELSKVRTIE